ncbi:MAG: type II toxin-antitoxin system VapC family toxin [Gemmatimonadota bacterium]|nr:type II toxin-antitoxin system VapC family toxin [Gemmatimonadota bacterium]MDE2871713.1 type II toxin-antitoxin system VapC family toxin [Gemmatimonadota bacterium]
MSAPNVFLDTGIFVAAMNGHDRYHREARAMFAGPTPRWHTSVLVWSEAYNWFLHRHGDEAARSFGSLVASLEGLVMFTADEDHHAEVCRMSDRMRRERLTYVDASSLVLIDRHGIGTVWSTDPGLGLTGAKVLPGS